MDKNSFMFAILNNPSLTQKDRERVISLITQDIEKDLMTKTQQYIREELRQKEGPHDGAVKEDMIPVKYVIFLRNSHQILS